MPLAAAAEASGQSEALVHEHLPSRGCYRHLEAQLGDIPNRLEIRLRPDGKVFINGLASSEMLDDIVSSVAKRTAKP